MAVIPDSSQTASADLSCGGRCDRLWPAMLVGLLIGFILLEYKCVRDNCVVVDELAHIPAGVNHWERGFFSLYHENPPLVRCLVALPVWLSSPRSDYSHERIMPGRRTEWLVGSDFAHANGDRYFELLFRARCVSVLFGVACGILIYCWTRELFGRPTGVVVAMLWLMDPGTLAHSGLATLDAGATFFGLLANYVFWRYLRERAWLGAILSGFALGLALASKFSMLALLPAWFVMALLAVAFSEASPAQSSRRLWSSASQFLLIATAALVVLNCCYGFEGTFARLGDYQFTSALLRGHSRAGETDVMAGLPSSNVFKGSILERAPVPLPVPYLAGFDSQKRDEEIKLYRVAGGRLVRGGNPLLPFGTLALKLLPGTLLLMTALGPFLLRGLRSADQRRNLLETFIAVTPGLVFLCLLATQTGLNWAFRYSLPAVPYLLIATGLVIKSARHSRICKLFLAFCLSWNAYELASSTPHFLSYSNTFAGGTNGGHRYFIGSNYDWGQDLLRLKRWADEHPQADPLIFACYNAIEPWAVGLRVTPLPIGTPGLGRRAGIDRPFRPYYLAISTNVILGLPGPVLGDQGILLNRRLTCRKGWAGLTPAARPAPSIMIFHIDSDGYDIFIDPAEFPLDNGATP